MIFLHNFRLLFHPSFIASVSTTNGTLIRIGSAIQVILSKLECSLLILTKPVVKSQRGCEGSWSTQSAPVAVGGCLDELTVMDIDLSQTVGPVPESVEFPWKSDQLYWSKFETPNSLLCKHKCDLCRIFEQTLSYFQDELCNGTFVHCNFVST